MSAGPAEPVPELESAESGVFGVAAVLRDFDEADVARLRAVAAAIRSPERPAVRSAIALSGSAAQSRVQPFPGDFDFFERVHIRAPSRTAAQLELRDVMVATIAGAFANPDLQFSEMKLGLHPRDRTPLSWTLVHVDARALELEDGSTLAMDDVLDEPGFVKLDWVHADHARGRLVNVSKVLDPTWESPDGDIVALDGVLDAFYQEVYLDPDSRIDVERLVHHVRPDDLVAYVQQLESEVRKYSDPAHANHGKVAKRLYNLCRVQGRAAEAAYLRSLFDDPPARLYQVQGMLHALEPALGSRRLPAEVVASQSRELGDLLRTCYSGDDRDELCGLVSQLAGLEEAARAQAALRVAGAANAQVSDYFGRRIAENEALRDYVEELRALAP
ncbi:MAG: hypothetical protein QOE65_2100 [Solirubrobacteraceae bacterium]|jgi:hypothetical protein|nr:hypothetical protein [Solirubrobacteraceae bacterium]